MTPLAPLVQRFFREHLPVERGHSQHTCDAYAYAFRLLLDFVSEGVGVPPSRLHLEHLDVARVTAFLEHLEDQRRVGATTRNARLAAIKSFMRFIEYREPSAVAQAGQVRAIPYKRHDHALVQHLAMNEVQAILDAPALDKRLGIRDRAMLHLCFAAGLRVSELVGLPLHAVSLGAQPVVHVLGKGRRERRLPVWKQTASDLRAWLAVRGSPPAPELFVNATGRAMTRSGFEYVLTKHVRAAAGACPSLRDRKVTPHQLRHSCAVLMLQATRDVRKVALWLGHADTRTTEVYLRVDPTEKLEAVEAAVPPQLRRGRFKAPDALIASLFEGRGAAG